ncbi:hypothetical protein EPA93_37175 [Ktedonosporobacter rubrisoli]|uniref:HAMP domain-containing protein n=1 Tax=Ktedonosporobacter rubrisoli TaxID=2509675 RepID=A0A4P6JZH8_KTERU|nr:hypothetical protein [Ktedonosporobacter rubrisoli]QBD81308.1 hypothetical protein EPA93_37175 [Ktedonosporobacter rubrisoli]
MEKNPFSALEDTQRPAYLTGEEPSKRSIWDVWYELSSPREPGGEASLQDMELFRRGRAGSQILLPLVLLLLLAIPAGFVGTNASLLPLVGLCVAALVGASFLNRRGKVTAAGILVVLTFLAFPIGSIVTTPDGLSILVLPLYGLLILPLVCAVSFLPPSSVFVVALINILFTYFSLVYLPRTAELQALLSLALAGTMTPIILSQIIIAVVAYAWVRGTTLALLRADRAEELARLEHDLALQAEESAQQKQQLEESIEQIVRTHTRVANGDFNARVPVMEGNVLWQISGPLNTLIARAQGWRQELARVQQENQLLLHALRRAGGTPEGKHWL